ncbi:3-hexulose-6-phosphate synthase [Metabacillus idriensis]|uniref:3-hexulose-6-phosphate synthase n=1 Tax=Metabacillus idriensis TaxID=324768 RepID=UPI00174DA75D|nr:3-hexulose-6-phosphate synthase [Metabacillus idriensis]
MKIQLALDRLSMEEAIQIASRTEKYIDIIEVGTSLIKEFGVASISKFKEAFPDKTILADMKTIDNALYEFTLSFNAGADIATVMGVSPMPTIEVCMEAAAKHGKKTMIDILNTTAQQRASIFAFTDAIFCDHISKDLQERSGLKSTNSYCFDPALQWAVAGGITGDSIRNMAEPLPDIVIVGSAITKAIHPEKAAEAFRRIIGRKKGKYNESIGNDSIRNIYCY